MNRLLLLLLIIHGFIVSGINDSIGFNLSKKNASSNYLIQYNCIIVDDTTAINNLTTASCSLTIGYTHIPDLYDCFISLFGLTLIVDGGTPPYTYLWDDGLTSPNRNFRGGSTTQTINVVVTDANGCQATTSVIVPPKKNPDIFVNNDSICRGHCSELTVTGNATNYYWNSLNTSTTSVTVCPYSTSIYGVTGSITYLKWFGGAETYQCDTTVYSVVKVNPILSLTVNATPTTILEDELSFLTSIPSSPNVSYVWEPADYLDCPSCNTTNAYPKSTTTYTLTISDSFGCIEKQSITVYVKNCPNVIDELFVPTIFSPNNDGQNDILYLRGWRVKDISFAIFDRWGQKIFESSSLSNGWDGTFKGKALDPGTYVYSVKATCLNGEFLNKTGNVSLVR